MEYLCKEPGGVVRGGSGGGAGAGARKDGGFAATTRQREAANGRSVKKTFLGENFLAKSCQRPGPNSIKFFTTVIYKCL